MTGAPALGCLLACLVAACPTEAAEVRPGGALDLEIGGDVKFYQAFGQLRERTGERGGSMDLVSDATVLFHAVGEDEASRLRYGAIIELRGSTAAVDNGDKTFVFLDSLWGELRLGDDDTVQVSWSAGADSIAVASGGLDGDIVDSPDLVFLGAADTDGTRLAYYSPSFNGFSFGGSLTPHLGDLGQSIGSTDSGEIDDLLEAAIRYEGSIADLDIEAMIGGLTGHLNADQGRRSVRGLIAGLHFEHGDLELAGAAAAERVGGTVRHFYNVGAAIELGAFAYSIGFGQCLDCEERQDRNLVLGAEVGIIEGVSLGLELSWLDPGPDAEADTRRSFIGLLGLRLEF